MSVQPFHKHTNLINTTYTRTFTVSFFCLKHSFLSKYLPNHHSKQTTTRGEAFMVAQAFKNEYGQQGFYNLDSSSMVFDWADICPAANTASLPPLFIGSYQNRSWFINIVYYQTIISNNSFNFWCLLLWAIDYSGFKL